jgi:glycosyltransferase involved in cell wall biosynthesis
MPRLTIIIPTYDRARMLGRAVESALAQTMDDLEVLVVDDGSPRAPNLPPDPRLRLLRSGHNRGHAAARNSGLRECRSQWVTFVDDDDELLPHMVKVSLAASAASRLPPPVGVLSGIETVDRAGRALPARLPPTLARGAFFSLEAEQKGRSFLTKQTLVVERDVLLSLGGFDESLRTRVHTDLFLRLNPVCSLQGVDEITYRRHLHAGDQLSRNAELRQESFRRLVAKHRTLLRSKPEGFARMLAEHARMSLRTGRYDAAMRAMLTALRYAPLSIVRLVASLLSPAGGVRDARQKVRT